MRVAIIDLGTNTFNLIIVELQNNGSHNIILNTKRAVMLGRGGILSNQIGFEAMERGFKAIDSLKSIIKRHQVEHIFTYATSAIREASNGREFAYEIEKRYGFKVEIISGDKEAEYIFKGVKLAVPIPAEPVLIVDIGGGSIETILVAKGEIFWKQSFKIGIARLLEIFSPGDPILHDEIIKIEEYLGIELEPLTKQIELLKPEILIGSSGSFDSLASMIAYEKNCLPYIPSAWETITLDDYALIHGKLLKSNLESRKHFKGLVLMRAEMIVLASVFICYIVEKYRLKKIIKSNFALKEGVIDEINSKLNR